MDKSNKTQINLTKRNFLKQIPIFFLGGIAVSTLGQNIFSSLFHKNEQELSFNDEFFTARDHKRYGSCWCANCMYEKNKVI